MERERDIATGASRQDSRMPKETKVQVDGFEQVFQMLKIADPAFRESLLQRLSARDIELARSLREKLALSGL